MLSSWRVDEWPVHERHEEKQGGEGGYWCVWKELGVSRTFLKASLPVVPFWITSGFEYYGMICLENPTSYPWQLGFENLGCGLTLLEDDVEADIEVEVEVEAACSWSCYPCRGRLAGP